eukprot:4303951-Pleurochrysis_carterae.AAC.1
MSSEFEAFCAQAGATKPIRRILIANNGMAARKFILSVHRHDRVPTIPTHCMRSWAAVGLATRNRSLAASRRQLQSRRNVLMPPAGP